MGGEIKMAYFEDEILKELVVGEAYTSRQLRIFVIESKNVLVLSKSESNFMNSNETRKLQVLDKIEAFAHKADNQSATYLIPNTRSIIYIVQ